MEKPGSWRELLGPRFAPVATVLAGGVLLEASNVYLTTSLLPTIVDDIGGADYYAWTMTTFLVASVITSMLVSRTLTTRGAVSAYTMAFLLFAAGSAVRALSPSMAVLLVGRAVQGLGGGLLAGLGYVLIQRALPGRLWARGAALVSTMWGVGCSASRRWSRWASRPPAPYTASPRWLVSKTHKDKGQGRRCGTCRGVDPLVGVG